MSLYACGDPVTCTRSLSGGLLAEQAELCARDDAIALVAKT